MRKQTKLIGAGLLLMTCLVVTSFLGNSNGRLLGISNVESLTAAPDNFYDMYVTNSERTLLYYTYNDYETTCIVWGFVYQGHRYDAYFNPQERKAYCCVSGSTHWCKPSGSNNNPWHCAYFGLGFKWWD